MLGAYTLNYTYTASYCRSGAVGPWMKISGSIQKTEQRGHTASRTSHIMWNLVWFIVQC